MIDLIKNIFMENKFNLTKLTLTRLTIVITLICLIGFTFNYILSFDLIYHVIYYVIRVFLLKIKVFWDWSYVYSTRCLILNENNLKRLPSNNLPNQASIDCYSCQDLTQINVLSALNITTIEDNLLNGIPFIVSTSSDQPFLVETMSDWPINDQHPHEILNQIYSNSANDDGDDDDYAVCMFASNLRVTSPNKLFLKLKQNPTVSWFAHWENCAVRAKKAIRRLYNRPEFIPSFIELTHPNWVLISGNNYKAKTWKKIELLSTVRIGILSQIKGQNQMKLSPSSACYQLGCDSLQVTLNQNDFLFFNSQLWNLAYLPINTTMDLAFLLGGSFETY